MIMRAAAFLVLFCAACAHLPPLAPLPDETRAATLARCHQAFPPQPWRATHTIFATLPFGHNGALIGVTAADAEGLHAILLSAEGISLFDGVEKVGGDGRVRLVARRAVPPFDRPDFAAALMSDVGKVFLSPAGAPTAIGSYATGETVCRWSPGGGDVTDVELASGGPARIRTYRNLHLTRQVELLGTPAGGFFPEVRLIVPGAGGYTLDMSLVDHE